MESHGKRSLWKNQDFAILWVGQAISTLGSGISEIVIPILILSITNSPLAAGIGTALRTVPYLLFSLPAGVYVDRWDRKKMMILCDIGRAIALGLVFFSMQWHFLNLWLLYIASLVEGTLFVFFNLAEVSALTRVVAPVDLMEATAQHEAMFGIMTIVAPSVGTLLYQNVGKSIPFGFDMTTYIISFISIFFIKTQFQGERVLAKESTRKQIGEGLEWLWKNYIIRFNAMTIGIVNFVNAAIILILIVRAKNLGATASQIGIMFSISGFGAILGSLIGGKIKKFGRVRFRNIILMALWSNAFLFFFYLLFHNTIVFGVIAGLCAIPVSIYGIFQLTHRLSLIPDNFQGRVNGVFRCSVFSFRALGSLLAGVLLQHFGFTASVITFGACLIALALSATLNRTIKEHHSIAPL